MGAEPDDAEPPDAAADLVRCAVRGHRFRRPRLDTCIRCGFVDPRVAPRVGQGRPIAWTPGMDAALLRCLAEGGTQAMAAAAVGVGPAAVRARLLSLSCRPEVLVSRALHAAIAGPAADG